MPPLVSAIIVSCNSAGTLSATLDALAGANDAADRIETIVADNGSTDSSVPVARAAGARIVALGRNRGFAAGCNAGAAVATGRILLFVNPDALVPVATALQVAALLAEHPDIGIAGLPHVDAGGRAVSTAHRFPTLGRVARETVGLGSGVSSARHVQGPLSTVHSRERPLHGSASAADAPLFDADWVQGSALAIPRALYVAVGGMDEGFFLYFEDVDLCRRVHAAGHRVVAIRDPACAVVHEATRFRKYHSRLKIYAWHRSCARALERQGTARRVVRAVLGVRAMTRAAFWTAARLAGRIDAGAYRERMGGYADTLRFCLGWRIPPLPSEQP